MEIDTRKLGGYRPTGSSTAPAGAGQSSAAPADQGVKDNPGVLLKLTDSASLMQMVQDTAKQGPLMDPAKIVALKEAISSGRYHVDANRVAAKFLLLEPDL